MDTDKTKEVLEQILAQLLTEQAKDTKAADESFLTAGDKQFLGNITANVYDVNSILNEYGPYGSQYSPTSIFNQYSQYGGPYGAYSISNPYCQAPPKLYIKQKLIGHISENLYVQNRISPKAFLYALHNNLPALLGGAVIGSETEARQLNQESFIEAADGTFLGRLNPNRLDTESIFNQFGAYGNKFSQFSIFNKFSNYGSQFSLLSPYNRFSQTPPKVLVNGKFVAYLTINSHIKPRISPEQLLEWAKENVSRFV